MASWRVLRVVALAFLAAKLVLLVLARPFMDETYYWMWGQHLSAGYLDHPPLIGWSAALGSVLGWNILGLRVFVLATLIGDLALLYLFARLKPGDWRERFWPSAAIFLATPLFFALSNVALPDHWLILFSLAALYCFERFRLGWLAGTPVWRWLYLAALAVGLATLSKYTGAILGVAVFAYVLAVPKLRGLFRTPHLYLAALLVLLLQTPMLVWNIQHGFVSFGFVVDGRAPLKQVFSLTGLSGFVLGALAILSPFLIWPMGRVLVSREPGNGLAKLIFWLSTAIFLVASLFTNILIHWNAVAYVALLPLLSASYRPKWLVFGHLTCGALVAGLVAVNYAVLPILAIGGRADQTSAWSYGWDEVAAEIQKVSAVQPVDFIAATDYTLASPLAFALHDPDVTSLAAKREAYDDWFDAPAHAGQTALIVADRWRPIGAAIKARFASVEEAGKVTVSRFGRPVGTYRLYIAKAFLPSSH